MKEVIRMKKQIKILMQIINPTTLTLELVEVVVVEYDKDTYYYSPLFKGNKNKIGLPNIFELIDKLTGICVVYSSNKDILFINYKDNYRRYQIMKKTEYYKDLSRKYDLKVREYKFENVY